MILLALLLLSLPGMPASALEGSETEEGFYIEELPAFGEEPEITFSEDVPQGTEPEAEPEAGQEIEPETEPEAEQETTEGDTAPEEDLTETLPEAQETPGQNNNPVILVIAVLAAGALIVLLAVKRKTLGDRK